MRRTSTIWIAALLGAIACRSSEPAREGAPKSVDATAAVPAMPIVQPGGAPQADDKTVDPASRAGRLAALQKEHNEAMNAWFKLLREAKTPEDRARVVKENPEPDTQRWAPAFWDLVREDSRDEVALEALQWLVRESRAKEDKDRALATILSDQIRSPKLGDFCDSLVTGMPEAPALLERILAASPHREVQGRAAYALARTRLSAIETARRIQAGGDPKRLTMLKARHGEERYAELAALDPGKAQADAEALLERVAAEYGDVAFRKRTLGAAARADLHEMRDLVVGKPAPEIEGEDFQGAAFKLSDYRGKVVMLDFWGHW